MNRDSNEPSEEDDGDQGRQSAGQERADRDRREARQMWRQVGRFGHIGLQFGIATGIGFLLGRWLDGKFGTAPWLAIVLALCGTASAAIDLYRLVRKFQKENDT